MVKGISEENLDKIRKNHKEMCGEGAEFLLPILEEAYTYSYEQEPDYI